VLRRYELKLIFNKLRQVELSQNKVYSQSNKAVFNEKSERITLNRAYSVKKAYWKEWRLMVFIRKEERIAAEFHKINVRKAVFSGLLKNSKKRKYRIANKSISTIHKYKSILAKVINGWHFLTLYNKPLRRSTKIYKDKYKTRRLELVFKTWRQYHKALNGCSLENERNIFDEVSLNMRSTERWKGNESYKYGQSEGVSKIGLLKKSFGSLRVHLQKKENAHNNKELAREFIEERYKLKVLRILSAYSKVKIMRRNIGNKIRLNNNMLQARKVIKGFRHLLKYNKNLRKNFKEVGLKKLINIMKRMLKTWLQKYKGRSKAKKRLTLTQNYKVKAEIYNTWKNITKQRKTFIKRLGLLLDHRASILISKAIAGLRRYKQYREVSSMNKKIAQMHYTNTILHKAMTLLKYSNTIKTAQQFLLHSKWRGMKEKAFKIWVRVFSETYKVKGFDIDRRRRMMNYYVKRWNIITRRRQLLRNTLKNYNKFAKIKYWIKWKRSLKIFY